MVHKVEQEFALKEGGVGAKDYAQGSRRPSLLTDEFPSVPWRRVDTEDNGVTLLEILYADLRGLIYERATHLTQEISYLRSVVG